MDSSGTIQPSTATSLLKDDLATAGIDIRATVATPNGPRPRFAFLTWGNETSTNDFAYASNVIMAGVLHRDDLDLAANVVGQKDDLLADYGDLRSIKQSEVAHCVYQALSRGSCRRIVNGEAAPMKAWIIHHDDTLGDTLRTAMAGVVWSEWTPKFIKGISDRKVKTLARRILDHLATHTGGTISTRSLKTALGLKDTPAKTFQRAVALMQTMTDGWKLEGRSLVATT